MSDTIKLRKAYKAKRVELEDIGGKAYVYETLPLTRSVIKQVSELEGQIVSGLDEDENIVKIAQILDVRLRPTNGSKVKASAIIKRLWEKEELDYPDAWGLIEDINATALPN
jgi:hypothetical protein